ncbi:hypothetical protein BIU87_05615 [Streptomyces sp. ZS0098]|uniref:hypothetical protein n=1 Tax=Streptomyces sp. ZS0098 TaxID=1904044 RepID=UPI000FEF60FA|nr:hypothetical protein [Streptomyces sp. ZS0098]RMI88165.1 hypothetical protein BIU87_05615 [Streptomyces sp. ZS0098]
MPSRAAVGYGAGQVLGDRLQFGPLQGPVDGEQRDADLAGTVEEAGRHQPVLLVHVFGASVTLIRNYACFGGHHTATAWWVLSAWAVGGVLVGALALLFRRRPEAADGPPSPTAAGGTGATA